VSEGALKTKEGRMWARRGRELGGKKTERVMPLSLT